MNWWKIEHITENHGDTTNETRFIYARTISDVIDVMSTNMHPHKVMMDLDSIAFEKVSESEVDKDNVFVFKKSQGEVLRRKLVDLALQWEEAFGVAPAVTSAISEYDAARLVGSYFEDYCGGKESRTAVTKGYDFKYKGLRYQVKACRPSGKKGSKITRVPKPRNYDWDKLIWIQYNQQYKIEEAWCLDKDLFIRELGSKERLSPSDMRLGTSLEVIE